MANLRIASDLHQGDEHFSVKSRGKQCALMSLSAILTAQNISIVDWSKTTLNVLLQGDKMYLNAVNNSLIVIDPGVEFLSVHNSPKVVSVSCCGSMFSHEIELLWWCQKILIYQMGLQSFEAQNNTQQSQLPAVAKPIETQ